MPSGLSRGRHTESVFALSLTENVEVALGGISSAHISAFSLTSAQANHVTRPERHPLCACLTFSTGICAADPRSTAYIQYSLRMSRPFQRHVCRETSSCALRGISPAHFSMARHGARTCRSYIVLAYNEIQKALVCGPYFRVGSTNKTCL